MKQYGGFWLRVVAAIIDGILLSIVNGLLRFIFGHGFFSAILSIVVAWIYYATLESSERQATLGKSVVGLHVTDMIGNRISFSLATGRHFAKYVSCIILCIGFIMVAFTKKKQGLHDLMAGTLVVEGRVRKELRS